MKSYTDIEQSKKLAEILPLESADMVYEGYKHELTNETNYTIGLVSYWKSSYPDINIFEEWDDTFMPCWSLAALLEILPYPSLLRTSFGWRCDTSKKDGYTIKMGDYADNPIDTCYEMIIKLHEQKLL